MKNEKMKKIIEGTITSPFGIRHDPFNSKKTIHQGADIAAPIGTPIYAPVDGFVSATYDHHSGGRTLLIQSQCGSIRFGFCHLSRFEKHVGEPVQRGSMIARSGNSGHSTGPHLHFSVKTGGQWQDGQYVGGQFVDPAKYIEIQ